MSKVGFHCLFPSFAFIISFCLQQPVSQEYFLGKYNMPISDDYLKKMQNWSQEKSKTTVQIDGVQMPYIEINMTDGTLCDLNNQPRFTRVLYVCNEQSKHELYSIKETYTCEYEAIVLTPFLCLHSDFKVDSASDLDINCFAMDNSPLKPEGYLEFEVDNRSKSSENLFDVKTIIIDASGLTDQTRIDLKNLHLSSPKDVEHEKRKYFAPNQGVSVDSKLLKNFLTGEHCLYGVS
jgi:XTP3-transactivated gene B protein-like protein